MNQTLPLGLTPIDLVTILVALAAFVAVVAVWSTMVSRDPMRGRVKGLQDRREALKAGFIAPKKRVGTVRGLDSVGLMRTVVNKLKLMQGEQTKKISVLLSQAGFRNRDSAVIFLFFKFVMPMLAGILAVVMVYGFKLSSP